MADPSVHVALPQAVEQLIEQICRDQNQLPPNVGVRQKLALIGEEEAVQVLRNISAWKITKSLSGCIMHMIRKSQPNSNTPSPQKIPRVSPHHSPSASASQYHHVNTSPPPLGIELSPFALHLR